MTELPATRLQPIENTNRDFVGSLEKGLRVLKTFGNGSERMTLSNVAQIAELPRAGLYENGREVLRAFAKDSGAWLFLPLLPALADYCLAGARTAT